MPVQYPNSIESAFRSSRLVYRAIEDDDADKAWFHKHLDSDPVNIAMGTWALQKPRSKEVTAEFVKVLKKNLLAVFMCLPPTPPPNPKPDQVVKEEEATPTPIGLICLFPRGDMDPPHHRAAFLGITIARPYRGKGYGGEAINWALDWGFMRAGLHRIGLGCLDFNPNAEKLYRSLGFVEEGRDRECVLHERKWHDIINFGMLEHEWERLRQTQEEEVVVVVEKEKEGKEDSVGAPAT
ncbi:acyl-CoA N-acyltransferase [Diplogelasinospora grovesii]|uniref:Acyl-CoA N-acyltransferase n=1 Tax=Diplogelasinospora grovesii TaxID=303347 RepID=A0AAN6N9M1_9PEZI|nr:acyl-CoA N-acyltransferase [Diplogelasinospora grovesii]